MIVIFLSHISIMSFLIQNVHAEKMDLVEYLKKNHAIISVNYTYNANNTHTIEMTFRSPAENGTTSTPTTLNPKTLFEGFDLLKNSFKLETNHTAQGFPEAGSLSNALNGLDKKINELYPGHNVSFQIRISTDGSHLEIPFSVASREAPERDEQHFVLQGSNLEQAISNLNLKVEGRPLILIPSPETKALTAQNTNIYKYR